MRDQSYDDLNRRVEDIFHGRYELLQRLGSGGMGMVFLAQARDIGRRRFALKIVEKASPENKGVDVYSEIRILRDLRHPNIIDVYEALEDRDYVYIVQEYVDGRNLAELRDDPAVSSMLDEETVRLWMIDIADALAYIHGQGIVHRDIKPGNIMVDSDGMAKLIDFGIARRTSTLRKSRSGSAVGSAPYSPLERLQGDADGVQTDIYAYGATFYSVLRKKIPSVSGRDINTLRTGNQSIEPYYMNAYRTMVGDLAYIRDEGIRDLIRSCVDIDPDKRVRDFNSVRYRLRSTEQVDTEHAVRKRSGRAAYIGLSVMLIAGIICTGLGIVQMRRDHAHRYEKIIEAADRAYDGADYAQSEEEARRAIDFDPGNEAGYITKYRAETAEAYELGSDEVYERIISESENDRADLPELADSPHAVTYVANAYYETDRFDEAAAELERLSAPEDDQLMLLGEALYKKGDMAKAKDALGRMKADVPQRFYLEGLIGEESDYEAAIASYEKVLDAPGAGPGMEQLRRKALTQIVDLQIKNGRADAAVTRINNAVKEDPSLGSSPKVNIMLMDCYFRDGRYAEAITQADAVIEKHKIAGAYSVKCSSQAKTGLFDDALATIGEWEKAFPDDARPHIHRAIIYNNIAGKAEADADRRKAYTDFIKVYEEERAWLEKHNAINGDFEALDEPYRQAVNILAQMEAEK